MNTRLLKFTEMKKFIEWLDVNNVHPTTWEVFKHYPESIDYKKLLKRQAKAKARNKFWKARCKSRPKFFNDEYIPKRIAHFSKASDLISYIIERKER